VDRNKIQFALGAPVEAPLLFYRPEICAICHVIECTLIKTEQQAALSPGILLAMTSEIYILKTEKDGKDGLIVAFSDGTTGAYIAEELIDLRPYREITKEQNIQNHPLAGASTVMTLPIL
jgi:hypothetical protein